jgi:acid phosphatase family membrane protein YuiD
MNKSLTATATRPLHSAPFARRCGAAAMEVLSSSRFCRVLPNLLDPVSRVLKPRLFRRRAGQSLACIPAPAGDAASSPSPSSPPLPSQSLSRLLAAALRGGRAGGELPDLAAAAAGAPGIGTLLMSTTAAAVTKARESPYLLALAANPTFMSGLVAWAVAQTTKAVLSSFVERRWDMRMLFSSGGMPSSHTALCTALTASVALCHGVSDALFPVCLGFTLIVMYDATGVRRHAGMQAEVSLLWLLYIALRNMTQNFAFKFYFPGACF